MGRDRPALSVRCGLLLAGTTPRAAVLLAASLVSSHCGRMDCERGLHERSSYLIRGGLGHASTSSSVAFCSDAIGFRT